VGVVTVIVGVVTAPSDFVTEVLGDFVAVAVVLGEVTFPEEEEEEDDSEL
jgi:hypothetical protein